MSSATTTTRAYTAAPALADVLPPPKERGRAMTFVHRHPTIVLGGALLLVMILIAILAPWLGTVDPTALAPAKRTREPSALYWFGTDMLGRDVYSRVMYGARISLFVGFAVATVASVVGTFIGLVSGFVRMLDFVVMRVMDGLMAIPAILLAIALMALTRASVQNVIIAISVAEFPRVSRLIRGVVLSLREQPYVEAATASGTRVPMIVIKHILPNTLSPICVVASFSMAQAILTEAGLSFLGVGLDPSTPSCGTMLNDGRDYLLTAWWIATMPGIAIGVTVLGVTLFGEGLRELLDPRGAR